MHQILAQRKFVCARARLICCVHALTASNAWTISAGSGAWGKQMKHKTSAPLVVLRALLVLSACLLSFIPIQPAHALLVYSNDFEGGVGAEWSSAMTETTPVGSRGFLGQFDNATITLTLALPTHSGVTVSFDLLIL